MNLPDQPKNAGKLPSFQFYPGDWMKDPSLRSVSPAARGIWVDLLCLMFESPKRGYLQHANGKSWTEEQIANAISCYGFAIGTLLKELEDSGVFSRTYEGVIYSRRQSREEEQRKSLSEIRSAAGAIGAYKRWQPHGKAHGKRMAKDGFSSSISSSDISNQSKKAPNPNIKTFIDWWCLEYQQKLGKKYIWNGGKESKAVERLLGQLPIGDLKTRATAYFDSKDRFITDGGYSLSVFSGTINKFGGRRSVSTIGQRYEVATCK